MAQSIEVVPKEDTAQLPVAAGKQSYDRIQPNFNLKFVPLACSMPSNRIDMVEVTVFSWTRTRTA